ncbi:MAG: adenine nucleotide alpha hydrolase family protein [Clostridia bacterium]|nr:adenine nucleotide alpha hydrolase family protein [Clostridia bacterium]
MQQLMSYMRSAIEKYNMIENGDKIAVGVSGGKDSLALLIGLSELRRFYPKYFELIAITLDPCFNGVECDYSQIEELCQRINIPYIIKRTELAKIIFETRKEQNPCSLCARMRRGSLHDIAKENGCNKIALGHHLDDAAETFMMNLLNLGQIGCFSPVSYLSRKDIYMIRPLIFATEKDVARAVNKTNLPVIASCCPVNKKTERENVKNLLNMLEKDYPGLRKKIVSSMQRGEIDNW